MSAWIVDKAVIDLLVEAFFRYEIPASVHLTPDALGRCLWKENYRSVNYRYGERRRMPAYTFEDSRMVYQYYPLAACGTVRELARDPLFLCMQIGCYCYQTCERDDWERSLAHTYVKTLEAAVLKGLGMTHKEAWDTMRPANEGRHFGQAERYPWMVAYDD